MEDNRITLLLAINKMIIGGAEQQFLELVKGLDKKRFKTIVVTLYPGGDLEPQIKNVSDIELICVNRKSKLDFSPLFAVRRILKQKKVDIIQPFLTPATFFVLLPAVQARTPVKVVTERGSQRKKAGLGYNLYLRVEDFFTRFADRVVPNSQSGENHLISRGISSERIRVIYNGINLQRLAPDADKIKRVKEGLGLSPEGQLVGISASLTAPKDHDTFLRAARLISREMPQVKFALLGDGPLRSTLENLTDELGIRSNVMFLGNQTDVGPYLATWDVACLCSTELEGCSNAILEAMALGKPVVATDAGGNRELVEDRKTGYLVPIRDPQALADGILACLRQPELSREMGQRAREVISTRFSLARMVRDYELLYEEMITAKKREVAR